jgi:hypothetical protein
MTLLAKLAVCVAVCAAIGCGRVTPLAPGDGGAGGGGGAAGDAGAEAAVDCSSLDEQTCAATPGCLVETCPLCSGTIFGGCYGAGEQPRSCPLPPPCPQPPPACDGLDEATCKARTDCLPQYCPGCGGSTFMRCWPGDTKQTWICPAIACIVTCDQVTTLAACEARADCHSVFASSPVCDCATAGCCIVFAACADGDKVSCTPSPACTTPTPPCGPSYVASFPSGSCGDCVQAKDCAP